MGGVVAGTQERTWSSLLADGQYEQAGQVLAAVPASNGLVDLGMEGSALLRLDLPQMRLVLRGMRSRTGASEKLTGLLRDMIRAQRGDPIAIIPWIRDLLEDPDYRVAVLPYLGRGALQLCRSGKAEGVEILERIVALYPDGDWAKSNLANGYRFVGQYDDALGIYDALLEKSGRQAWFLNGKALVLQARFDTEKALSLYLEGGAETCPGERADRFTNRTNAAVLLISRGGEGDLDRAEQLLDSVVSRDSAAIRAAYYRRWAQRLRKRLASR